MKDVKRYCIKIAPHIEYYRKQIAYYNQTAADILTNELALILPTFPTQDRQKRGIITSLITGFIGLAYEGISSFLHHKRQKALHKAVNAIDNKVDLQRNKIFHLEDSMVMYGMYNSDTLEDLINTVHKLHNRTTWNEKLFSGQIENWYNYYLIIFRCATLCNKFIAISYNSQRKICKNVRKISKSIKTIFTSDKSFV